MENIKFDIPEKSKNVLKAIGVGGGGCNMVNYMYSQGIEGVDFVICNTDAQQLRASNVPIRVQLGESENDSGYGAGADPEVAKKATMESEHKIREVLKDTKMIFLAAGMGGGTGTGASPIIAKIAKELGVLTVAIVTIPFEFEGEKRIKQAEAGISKLKNSVDSIIVVNNQKLVDHYGNLEMDNAFVEVDKIITIAAKGMAEVITKNYRQNIDLNDAIAVLKDSGTALFGMGKASGEGRALKAVKQALDSPLLNDNSIKGSKKILLLIIGGEKKMLVDEYAEINNYVQGEVGNAGNKAEINTGYGDDPENEDNIFVAIVATGFDANQQRTIVSEKPNKIIKTLNEDESLSLNLNADNQKYSIFETKNYTNKSSSTKSLERKKGNADTVEVDGFEIKEVKSSSQNYSSHEKEDVREYDDSLFEEMDQYFTVDEMRKYSPLTRIKMLKKMRNEEKSQGSSNLSLSKNSNDEHVLRNNSYFHNRPD